MTKIESIVRQLIDDGDLYADSRCTCCRCRAVTQIKRELERLPVEPAPRFLGLEAIERHIEEVIADDDGDEY